jgi:hypothetical protein
MSLNTNRVADIIGAWPTYLSGAPECIRGCLRLMFSVLIISHYTDLHLRTEMFSVYHMSIFIKYSFNVSAVY